MKIEKKFRAYSKLDNKYLYPYPEGFTILGEVSCFDLIMNQMKELHPDKTTLSMLNDVELLQFTGKKDKNNKEIYEGDYNSDGECVIWCDRCNGWEFAQLDLPTKEIVIDCHRCEGNFFFEDVNDDFIIVGNIVE